MPAGESALPTGLASLTSEATPTPSGPAPIAPPTTSRVAPLVSATRFVAATEPINVLQAPTAPVDQPVRAAESIVGSFAGAFANAPSVNAPLINTPSINMPSANTPFGGAGSVNAPPTSAIGALAQAASQAAGSPSPRSTVQQAVRETSAAVAPVMNAISGGGSPHQSLASQALAAASAATSASASTAANDHAALDTLARQLYGRFSRHLAGELLIDRERAQFLTDLT